jgi:hypothetical protein
MNIRQELGPHEVRERTGAATLRNFYQFAVLVFSDSEDNNPISGIRCHKQHVQVRKCLQGTSDQQFA